MYTPCFAANRPMDLEDMGKETLPWKLGWLLLLVIVYTIMLFQQLYIDKPVPLKSTIALWIFVPFFIIFYVY